jgi:hypothetical protein
MQEELVFEIVSQSSLTLELLRRDHEVYFDPPLSANLTNARDIMISRGVIIPPVSASFGWHVTPNLNVWSQLTNNALDP